MATTSEGLWYPDGTDIINPLHPVLAAMQTSVGVNPRMDTPAGIHSVADATGLTTLANDLDSVGYTISVSNPAYAYRADTQMIYENRGSGWAPYSNTLQFADATARDTAIPSGNRHVGMVAVIGTGAAMAVTVWDGSAWRTVWPDDTGWQALTVTGFSGGSARWRAIGRWVFWEYHGTGLTGIAAAGVPSGGAVAAAIPVAYRPANPTPLVAVSGTLQLGTAVMNSNGIVGYRNTSPASVTEVHINGSWAV